MHFSRCGDNHRLYFRIFKNLFKLSCVGNVRKIFFPRFKNIIISIHNTLKNTKVIKIFKVVFTPVAGTNQGNVFFAFHTF